MKSNTLTTDASQDEPRPILDCKNLRNRLWWAALACIFLIGLGLRVNCLDCYSLWYDEIASVITAQRGLDGIFSYRFGWLGNQTPLHYILVWLSSQVSDPAVNAGWVRAFSVLSGVLAIPVLYRLGATLFSRAHGLLAALLAALTPTLLDYSQELRPYSMLMFLTLLSVMCLVEAARGGHRWWWVGFMVSTLLNLLNSVVALTMVLPALGLYCLYLVWQFWRGRQLTGISETGTKTSAAKPGSKKDRRLLFLIVSLGVIGCFTLPMLLDLARTPRLVSSGGEFTVSTALGLLIVLSNWFTQLDQVGIGGVLESVLSFWLLAAAFAGALLAMRAGKADRSSAVLLIIFLIVPWLTLSYLMANFYVVQRYVIGCIPFYLLLISYAIIEPFKLLGSDTGDRIKASRVVAAIPLAVTVLMFGAGAVHYTTVDEQGTVPHRPDFRAATAYLSASVQEGDTILFADQNALGYTSAMFYWHDIPPAPTFDARDPRAVLQPNGGDIYWVFSSVSETLIEDMLEQPASYEPTVFRHGVVVVRDRGSAVAGAGGAKASTVAHLDAMVEWLQILRPGQLPFSTLYGSALQGHGQLLDAAGAYRAASMDSNKVLGFEYLRTAQGFAERGDISEAWREAAISKFMWPGNPDLHEWLSMHAQRAGYEEISRDEAEIARLLRLTK